MKSKFIWERNYSLFGFSKWIICFFDCFNIYYLFIKCSKVYQETNKTIRRNATTVTNVVERNRCRDHHVRSRSCFLHKWRLESHKYHFWWHVWESGKLFFCVFSFFFCFFPSFSFFLSFFIYCVTVRVSYVENYVSTSDINCWNLRVCWFVTSVLWCFRNLLFGKRETSVLHEFENTNSKRWLIPWNFFKYSYVYSYQNWPIEVCNFQ